MKLKTLVLSIILICLNSLYARETTNKITINADSVAGTISRHIYGHFMEHLGRCVYGGIWVGENSPIPNTRGMRNDIVKALKDISIPNLRWPGGCFADSYHWKDGIGRQSYRKKIVNTSWGGVVEDNSFGTHEFLDLCEQLDCEPVISANIGSGTVQEAADWVEYVTSDAESPMTNLRKKNGREKPWKVKYWDIGNETWGCGGIMSADFYANEAARYSWFMKNYGDNQLYKIASGGLVEDYNWTETIMKKWSTVDGWLQSFMSGYSLHYYTVCHDWTTKGSATDFNEDEWFLTLSKTLKIDELVTKHGAAMDKYDPDNRIGLIVDEWGNWHDVEPGTNPGFLFQQNTLRDALVAAVNFDIFNKHCNKVKMANIAQIINVLQSVVLTKGEQMLLTPTYYVFKMYKVHHNASLLPLEITSDNYTNDDNSIPALTASASKDSKGLIHLTLSNLDPNNSKQVKCQISSKQKLNLKRGEILTGKKINSYNDFGKPEEVNIREFKDVKVKDNNLTINIPSKSIVMIELQ